MQAVLASPHFLFRVEQDARPGEGPGHRLDRRGIAAFARETQLFLQLRGDGNLLRLRRARGCRLASLRGGRFTGIALGLQRRKQRLGKLGDLLAKGRLPLSIPTADGLRDHAEQIRMQPPDPCTGVAEDAELRDGRVVHVEGREDRRRQDAVGLGVGKLRKRELDDPGFSAADEDIADELRVLGLQRAGLGAPHSEARSGGDFHGLRRTELRQRAGDAEAEAKRIVRVHRLQALENLLARGPGELGPCVFDGAHAENPRQPRHRRECRRDAGTAFQQAVAHEPGRPVLVARGEAVRIAGLGDCGEFRLRVAGWRRRGAAIHGRSRSRSWSRRRCCCCFGKGEVHRLVLR